VFSLLQARLAIAPPITALLGGAHDDVVLRRLVRNMS
jgi:hypothetical protein